VSDSRAGVADWLVSLTLGIAAAIGAAVIAAIVLTIVNLYLSGHSLPALDRPWIDWPSLGVHLSRADLLLLTITVLTGGWFTAASLRRRRADRRPPSR